MTSKHPGSSATKVPPRCVAGPEGPRPAQPSINWNRPDTTIANSVVVALDANGLFQTRTEGAGGAHLVIDVVGCYL